MKKLLTLTFLLLFWSLPASASIKGSCSGCHTMHNSQDGASMNFDASEEPNEALLRGTCFGCHAQMKNQALISVGVDNIPQVMHTEATDLAGGNFAFITGAKGLGASDTKGHNIAALTGEDDFLTDPPGEFHTDTVSTAELTCAGTNGCHGYRMGGPAVGINGAHHANVDGKLAAPRFVSDSYRFLYGVRGLEDNDWQYTKSDSDHNEYFGVTSPAAYNCTTCHDMHGPVGLKSQDGTISQFCASCHGRFHTLETMNNTRGGIGASASSPFIRHPTDIILPNEGEYSGYENYDVNVPVARQVVPDMASSTVNRGSDVVICLSCHASHASNYPDMLRWDYATGCNTNTVNTDCGCFTCHTAKDGETTP